MRYWMMLLSTLTGGLSLFSLAQRFWNFGLAPLMQQFLQFYRAILHPVVGFITDIVWWVAAIPFVDSMVQATIHYWKQLWNATLVYVLQLVLPISWFQWIESTYLRFVEWLFGMSSQTYCDLYILSFVLVAPAYRALYSEEHDKLVPPLSMGEAVSVPISSALMSLPLLGVFLAPLLVLNPGYLIHFGMLLAAGVAYYALNAQL